MRKALKDHWPEYLMEAAELGLFMISACLFTIALYHPGSPLVHKVPVEFHRRIWMGLTMGATAIGIVYSPWGRRSGAHMNPAVTLTFFRLGKVAPWDAVTYIAAQFAGGIAGVGVASIFLGGLLANPAVNYASTAPGPGGPWRAFAGEFLISFILLLVVLAVSNHRKLARYTALFAGLCVATFIIFESPFSGMSMNPARTLGSAIFPGVWNSIWIYFTAPPMAMLLAGELFPLFKGRVICAKYHHQNNYRCIFCEYQASQRNRASSSLGPEAGSERLINGRCIRERPI
jgi:aquaporin Z